MLVRAKKMSSYNLKVGAIAFVPIFLIANPARGQLIPDRTLGAENSSVVPVSSTREEIRGGAARGSNLFHSFQEFNVNSGTEVYFANPTGVRNIINRVTGSNISDISGRLGVNGNANLYLINPNGIIFGDGAILDVTGTFIGTTADGIKLGNNDVYSGTDPARSKLLTIAPGALFVDRFRNGTRSILNQGNLQVNNGGNLTLSADAINNNGAIVVPGGNVFLEALNGNLNIGNIEVSSLTDSAENTITNGGDISLFASGNITLNEGKEIKTEGILGGAINIETQKDLIVNNGFIRSYSTGNVLGKAEGINVKANSVVLKTSLLTSRNIKGTADVGDITVNTDLLRLEGGGQISTSTVSEGDGGNLIISADKIELIGTSSGARLFPSGLFSSAREGTGNAGDLIVTTTGTLRLEGGAIMYTGVTGGAAGNGGNLIINAGNIELIGADSEGNASGLFSSTERGTGNAGNMTLTTRGTLRVEGGAQISTSTFTSGASGNLTVNAGNIEIIGTKPLDPIFASGLYSTAARETGDAGNLTVTTTGTLRLVDGGIISTATFTTGASGNLTINAANIELIGTNPFNSFSTGLFSSAIDRFFNNADSNGGDIAITTKRLAIFDGAIIDSSNFPPGSLGQPGLGSTGNINISAEEIVLNRGRINVSGFSKGGGTITIDSSKFLTLENGSQISTDVGETIDFPGGNININTPIIIANPDLNRISATAVTSQGGTIDITTNLILGYPQFLSIDATSRSNIDGTVNINRLSDEITKSGLEISSTSTFDARAIIDNDICAVRDGKVAGGSSFTIIGKGGIIPNPRKNIERSRGIIEWSKKVDRQTLIRSKNNISKPSQSKNLQPAVGWYRHSDGTVVLTADPNKVRPLNLPVDRISECR